MTNFQSADVVLAASQTWRSASGQTSREILDFETQMGGERLIRYRESSNIVLNTQAKFREWIDAVQATLSPNKARQSEVEKAP